jgi:hypothetical protein
MSLLIAYVACLVVGQSVTIGVGVAIDRLYSKSLSLPVSLALYFLMFWFCWKLAVRITEPKSSSAAPPPESPPA